MRDGYLLQSFDGVIYEQLTETFTFNNQVYLSNVNTEKSNVVNKEFIEILVLQYKYMMVFIIVVLLRHKDFVT